jgi:hypothetical protein
VHHDAPALQVIEVVLIHPDLALSSAE